MIDSKSLPIGVFDSGLGGLTIVKAIQKLMPQEKLIYFGDTAHLPYGDKSPETIRQYAKEITHFLLSHSVKAIVIACNSASAVALDTVKAEAKEVPVFDVVRPASLYASSITQNRHIGVIGTRATIASGIYKRLLTAISEEPVFVAEKATPLLVPMIEEGWLQNQISLEIIHEYLSDNVLKNIDTLILGCTHYPLIKNQIQDFFSTFQSNPVTVVDSSMTVAAYLQKGLDNANLLNSSPTPAQSLYFFSDFSQNFEDSAKLFLGKKVTFERVEL